MARSSSKQPKPDIEKKKQNERQRLEKALEVGWKKPSRLPMRWL